MGNSFQLYDDTDIGEIRIRKDEIKDEDAWGFKGKVSLEKGSFRWYAQSAYMGLVADAGPTEVITFTGWKLKDTGSGNQKNVITGVTYNRGDWQIGPNFLWQKPIVGPVPGDAPDPGRPRNLLVDSFTGKSDPFAVLGNREMTGGELLLTYDPHPATWFYAWDNVQRESARFAFNLGFVYKDMPTTRDALVFYDTDGITQYVFPGAAPGHTEWEIHSRITGRLGAQTRLVANFYAGQAEPNGWLYPSPEEPVTIEGIYLNNRVNRIIHRYGADARLTHKSLALMGMIKINDWGIYDYHRDWNLTYPLQLIGGRVLVPGPARLVRIAEHPHRHQGPVPHPRHEFQPLPSAGRHREPAQLRGFPGRDRQERRRHGVGDQDLPARIDLGHCHRRAKDRAGPGFPGPAFIFRSGLFHHSGP